MEFDQYVVQFKEDVQTTIEGVKISIKNLQSVQSQAELLSTFLELSEFRAEDLAKFEMGL